MRVTREESQLSQLNIKKECPHKESTCGQIRQTTELFIYSELTRMKGVISSDYLSELSVVFSVDVPSPRTLQSYSTIQQQVPRHSMFYKNQPVESVNMKPERARRPNPVMMSKATQPAQREPRQRRERQSPASAGHRHSRSLRSHPCHR